MAIEAIVADLTSSRHLGDLLADAFDDDPFWLWLAPDDRRRHAHLASMFTAMIRPRVQAGLAFTTTDDGGVAVWSAPNRWKMTWRENLNGLLPSLRTIGPRRIGPGLKALARFDQMHPREPHWYLEFLAANARMRGRGYGSALITPMLERADDEGIACYLESSKRENLPFYNRFGFEVTSEFHVGDDSPPMWAMWREAR